MPNELEKKISATNTINTIDKYFTSPTANGFGGTGVNCSSGSILGSLSQWTPTPSFVYNKTTKIYKVENGYIVEKEGKTYIVKDKKELVQYF